MSQYFAPARRVFLSSRASPFASTSAFTLNSWASSRPLSTSHKTLQPARSASEFAITSEVDSDSQVEESLNAQGSTTHYRVTLRRSAIGLPERFTKVLKAMGLVKRLQSVYLPQKPGVAGSILAVKELVHVDNVRRLDPPVGSLGSLSAQEAEEEIEAWHASVKDEDAVWVDAKGEVIDWGREARKAPRGFRVVGNLLSRERDEQIKLENEVGL